jgi:hypothetical protein
LYTSVSSNEKLTSTAHAASSVALLQYALYHGSLRDIHFHQFRRTRSRARFEFFSAVDTCAYSKANFAPVSEQTDALAECQNNNCTHTTQWSDIASVAAWHGNLACLDYVITHRETLWPGHEGLPVDAYVQEEMSTAAAIQGHVHVLQWLSERNWLLGSTLPQQGLIDAPLNFGTLNESQLVTVIEWLLARGHTFAVTTAYSLAHKGMCALLKRYSAHIDWSDASIVWCAASSGCVPTIEYAMTQTQHALSQLDLQHMAHLMGTRGHFSTLLWFCETHTPAPICDIWHTHYTMSNAEFDPFDSDCNFWVSVYISMFIYFYGLACTSPIMCRCGCIYEHIDSTCTYRSAQLNAMPCRKHVLPGHFSHCIAYPQVTHHNRACELPSVLHSL